MRFPQGKTKALTFSYDDGVVQDQKLSQIITEYGMKCTFNLNDAFIGSERRLTEQEIKDYILDRGHEIAVHGNYHIAPGLASAKDGINDMLEGRRRLEQRFSRIVKGMAYPDSGINNLLYTDYRTIRDYLQMLEIAYGRTLAFDNNNFKLPDDWYSWVPTCHHNNPNLLNWLKEFKEINNKNSYIASRYPRLFYLWGHSYEFDQNNNWHIIKEFCKQAADCENIWFATNIEICQYVKAFDRLEFSVDNTIVYNPTLKDIWFCLDDNDYVIKSGETLYL